MTAKLPAAAVPAWRLEAGALGYGIRLGAAVLLAFGASALLHLPEGFWAVMSALIVVRADTGGTLGAGWNRIRGALLGTGLGLLAALWRQHAPAADAMGVAPLVLVTVLSFAAGLAPALRSAPISALIVVTAGGIAGHSASQVALLRALEIGLGIAAALVVSLADRGARATIRFRAAAAGHLRDLAEGLDATATRRDDGNGRGDDEARRAALRRIAVLADAADRETRVLGRGRRGSVDRHRQSARLLARIGHDAALFERLRAMAAGRTPAGASVDTPFETPPRDVAETAASAMHARSSASADLRAFADALEEGRPSGSCPFPSPNRQAAPAARDEAADAQVALALLRADLAALARLEGRGETTPPRPETTTVP